MLGLISGAPGMLFVELMQSALDEIGSRMIQNTQHVEEQGGQFANRVVDTLEVLMRPKPRLDRVFSGYRGMIGSRPQPKDWDTVIA
jgi:hypothetical protein